MQPDTDNLLEPTAAEKWAWYLESHPECAFVKGYSVGFDAQQYLWWEGFHSGPAFLTRNLVDATSAIRRAVHEAVGGYDETIREGLEDWDFWLRCAAAGHWGATLPEFLDWYRRRQAHTDRWATWDGGAREEAFRETLRRRYGSLWTGGFPTAAPRAHLPYETLPTALPWANRLRKEGRRLLLLAPWLSWGGSDKFNLDLLGQLTRRGWEVTVATTLTSTDPWLAEFARYTPDIFVLHRMLRLPDYPRFVRYLIESRQVDVVLASHSEFGYWLLPYLRACCPDVTLMDLDHIAEESWKNGGYPHMAVECGELLDLSVVTSEQLRQWMVERGAAPARTRVCYTNVDTERWCPDPESRAAVRGDLGLSEAEPVVLYAARICEQKQPRVFAQTMLRLARAGVPSVALVAGDGPDLPWLHSFVRRESLSKRVRLLGEVSNERVRALMAAADVFFLPSRWEGIAVSIYEAMACGLPVVGAAVGGQRELLTPECGVLIDRGDEEAEATRYAEVLAELLRDPQRRMEMGRAGRDRVARHFPVGEMGDRMYLLLEEAMRLHRVEPRPVPGGGLGRLCAAHAVEYVRLTEVSDGLWRAQDRALGTDPWRTLAYAAIRRSLGGCYRAALDSGLTWIVPLKDRVKRALVRGRQA